jgi:hypothetical protein
VGAGVEVRGVDEGGVEGEVLVAGGVVLGGVAGLLGEPGAGVGVVARCTVVLVGSAAGVPVAWVRGAPGSPVAGVGGAAGGVVAVGGGVAEVSGRRWTVGDCPEAVEPVEVGAAVVGVAGADVAGVEGGRPDGAEGEAVAGGVDGAVLGGMTGLPGEPGAGDAAGARCTVVLVGDPAGVPVAWLRGASGVPASPVARAGGAAGGVVAVGGGVAEASGRRWTAGEDGAAAVEAGPALVEPVEAGPAVVGADGVEEVLVAGGAVLGGVAGLPGEPGVGVAAGARCTVVLVGSAADVPVASLRGASGSPAAGVGGGVVAVGGGVAEVSGRRWTAGAGEGPAEGVPVAEEAPSAADGVGDAVARGSPGAAAPPWSGVEGPGAPDGAEGAAGTGATGTAGERGPSAACGERDVDGT